MLSVSLAVVADAANISREGKLNITGIFNNINAMQFPAVQPSMVLVFVIEGDRSDAKAEHKMKLDFIDQDGTSIIPSIEGNIRFGEVMPGHKLYVPQIINMANVQFGKAGLHEIKIILNGEVRAEVSISVIKMEQ